VTGAQLLIRCLEREGVRYVFGVPGEETLALNDALLDSSVRFVSVRHEQAAAFMADVWGRLTGRAGVCLATLGPGATNLATGLADATLDRAPVVAITGQLARSLLHKESHQYVDIVEAFRPFTKWNTQIETGPVIFRGRAQGLQGRRGGEAWGLPHGAAGGCSRGGCRG
jgi:acetolactate synthase I/II/III large subunit